MQMRAALVDRAGAYVMDNPRREATPTKLNIHISTILLRDRFYTPPKEVQCFIERYNNEVAELGQYPIAYLHSINRSVTIFYSSTEHSSVGYEVIEAGLVKALDYYVAQAKRHSEGKADE